MRSLCIMILLAAVAMAQPTRQPPVTQFPQIGGGGQNRFVNSQIQLLAGTVGNEINTARGIVNQSRVPQIYKGPLDNLAAEAHRDAEALRMLAARGGNIEQLRQADAAMDRTMAAYSTQLARFANYAPAAQEAMGRANFAEQQLHNALHHNGGGGGIVDPKIERVRRVAGFLEEQAEALRDLVNAVNDGTPGARELERAARSFSFKASRFNRAADDTNVVRELSDNFALLIADWQRFGQAYANIRPTTNLRLQATRVEGTIRNLADMIPPLRPNTPWDWDLPNAGPQPGPGFGFMKRGAFVVGAGLGGGPRVRLFADVSGEAMFDFFAYDLNFTGGVRVAVADINGDRVPDLITAPGPGMAPLIRVFDGRNMRLLTEFLAFDPQWTGGVWVAAADRNRFGQSWIAVSADNGGPPHVKVFDLVAGKELDSFYAYDERFRGGCRIALGDVNGDGTADVLTVPGPGLEPRVKVFDGRNRNVISDFLAFDRNMIGGLTIDASDLTKNGRADMIVGTDEGQVSVVRIFDAVKGQRIGELVPFARNFRGGVRVAGYDFDGDGVPDVACSPGRDNNLPAQPIRVYSGVNSQPLGEFYPFGPDFKGGAYVGSR